MSIGKSFMHHADSCNLQLSDSLKNHGVGVMVTAVKYMGYSDS